MYALSLECGVVNRVAKIINGQETEVHEYPWHVGLVYDENSAIWCGGSIISSIWILTAAHCVEKLV